MTENLSLAIIRGAESWQFFAFVFGALMVLFYGLIDELESRLLKVILKLSSFAFVGYFTLFSPTARNFLAGLLDAFKTKHH